ncbi:MAG: hypothetical protein P4M15_12680 [Alphaproteobacteria bacterium]|nr:hypothetical protein [Alphaproteobacteria bacterium]
MSFLKPPFRGLIPFLLAYFVLCFVVHPQSALMQGRFVDPDDTMYAVQSAELLDGQGWYDRVEHRMNPPANSSVGGTPFHFTRLMELPYAATLAVLTPLLGRENGVIAMTAVWPPVFLLGMLLLFRKQARLFVPKAWATLAAFIGLTAQGLLFDFMPGHIDHHGFVALLIEACLVLFLLVLTSPRRIPYAATAGALMALALVIGLETLPWLLAFTTFLGVWASLRRERAAAGVAYAGAMLGTGIVLLPTYRLDFFTLDLTAYSIVYVALLFGIFMCLGAIWLLRHNPDRVARMTMGAIFAALAGIVFLSCFPDLLQGPYGAVDARLMQFMLPNTKEAMPLVYRVNPLLIAVSFLPFPLAALGVCLWQMEHTRQRTRTAWLLITLMHALGLILALFYQSRYVPYSQMFGVIPLAWLLWQLARRAPPWRAYAYAAVPVLFAALPLVTVYDMPAINGFLYPMMSYNPPCDVAAVTRILNMPPYGDKPLLIMNTGNEGPDILLHTRDSILAASFHENVSGNLDALDFFRADTAEAAAAIVRKRKPDLVLMCENVDRGYVADPTNLNYALPHPFIQRLLTGELPPWLEHIPLDAPSQVQVFRVLPDYLP